MLEEREAFLRAIFDAPDDDTPRLVYADWLEEHGFASHAGLIRVQCELARREPGDRPSPETYQRQAELIRAVNAIDLPAVTSAFPNRGFRFAEEVSFLANELSHPAELRQTAAISRPEWFGATRLRVRDGLLATAEQVATIFELPCFERVAELDLTGQQFFIFPTGRAIPVSAEILQGGQYRCQPVISSEGLERLVQQPGCERLRTLLLYNNDLDNAAVAALVRSPYLGGLTRLELSRGNRFDAGGWQRLLAIVRGGTWERLVERFGQSVVS
jgi:uncharacterized protein (TIGR02996 family)